VEKLLILESKDVEYYYPENTEPALQKINLSINEGEFVLLIGGSGSGKSTLVKALAGLVPDFYGGKIGGEVKINGENIAAMDKKLLTSRVGMVFQDPESQLVMTSVEYELAFGMENLGLDNSLIKKRIAELSAALSLGPFLLKSIFELSGGLKQKVILAAVLAMQPDILILDEPTSQLDPVAGEEILTMVRRLNEENGITVILIEQRLERCFHLADRFIVMEQGRITADFCDPAALASWAVQKGSPFIPPLAGVFARAGWPEIPLTLKEGRRLIRRKLGKDSPKPRDVAELAGAAQGKEPCLDKMPFRYKGQFQDKGMEPLAEVKKVWFVYDNGTEALRDVSLNIYPRELLFIMGENASGKTTLLKNITGLLKPSRGQVRLLGQDTRNTLVEDLAQKVAYLSQNPNDYLFLPTVQEEMEFALKKLGLPDDGRVEKILKKLDLLRFRCKNPRDLSTGERQRVALAGMLLGEPSLILLDEPTRGLDYDLKLKLGKLFLELKAEGKSLVVVTHDVEFAAEYADNVVLMSQGEVIAVGSKYDVLSSSAFYSPQISKLFRGFDQRVIKLEEGAEILTRINREGRG